MAWEEVHVSALFVAQCRSFQRLTSLSRLLVVGMNVQSIS